MRQLQRMLVGLVCLVTVLGGTQAPASAARPITVKGHSVSFGYYERTISQQCGPYSSFWGGWWKNGCSTKVRSDTFDKGAIDFGKVREWTSDTLPGTRVEVRTVQKGRTLLGVQTKYLRNFGRRGLCDWRVDLEYVDYSGRVWLVDEGRRHRKDPDCITRRNGELHPERNERLVLPRFVPRRGEVCAQLFVQEKRRPERTCVPITDG